MTEVDVYNVVDGLLERHEMHSEFPEGFTVERGQELLDDLDAAGLQLLYVGALATPEQAVSFLQDWCSSADMGRDGLTATDRKGFIVPPR